MFGHYGLGYYMDPTYILVIVGALLCMAASANVSHTFSKYSNVANRRGYTGKDVAELILRNAGITGVAIEHIGGDLTDHFDPRANVVRLSDSVYSSRSVAAIGVAAHECGHVIQHHKGYVPIKVRNAIVPIVNIGSKLAWPVIILGIILGALKLTWIGIILFSFALVFQVVTLPVEFDASNRALKILDGGILDHDEVKHARKVLGAAAMTYVTATISTLLQLLRLVLLFSRRDD